MHTNIGPLKPGVLFIMFLLAAVSHGRDIYVSLNGINNPPFTNWPDASTNIQWAVNAATAGETVWVSNGTYYLTNQINLTNSILFQGYTNEGGTVIINGNNYEGKPVTNRCLYVANTGAVVDGFTITGGLLTNCPGTQTLSSNAGAGVYCNNGTIRNCLISNNVIGILSGNSNGFGAGVYLGTSNSFLYSCTVANNSNAVYNVYGSGQGGGGIYASSGALVSNCTIIGNTINCGLAGGGILLNGLSGNTMIKNSTIAGNTAVSYGGGIYLCAGAIVQDCLISNNYGGGVCFYGDGPSGRSSSLLGCTVISNNSDAAVYLTGQNYVISNCFIICNNAVGGIKISTDLSGSNTVKNCTISNNVGYGILDYSAGTRANIITNCTITGNSSYGIRVRSNGGTNWPYIVDCQIKQNGDSALHLVGGTVVRCTIADNNVGGNSGGGIYFTGATSTNAFIDRCIVSSNIAANGGGLYYNNYGGTLRNGLIVNNRATQSSAATGGGIYLIGTNGFVQNCTVSSNSASNSSSGAGGLYYAAGGTNFIENTIIYYNTSGGANSNIALSGAGSFSNCCIAPTGTIAQGFLSGNIQTPPQLVNYQAGDCHLTLSSPCINAGVNRDWMTDDTVDLDGRRRLDHFSRIVDMGCYEYLPSGSIYQIGF